jgi:hypothetical protein
MKALIAAVACVVAVGVVASADKSVSFGFVCAKAGLPADVKPVVAVLVAKHAADGVRAWGDRAVALSLRRGSAPTYFVPLSCGATGNCTWAIVAGSPARSLGVASAAVIMTSVGSREWPLILMFTTSGAGAVEAESLTFSGDGYRHMKQANVEPALAVALMRCLDNESCCAK